MSATLDANILLYASDEASQRHAAAAQLLGRFAAGPDLLYLFWPVIMAYLRIATHPGVFEQPLAPQAARSNIGTLLAKPHVRAPGESGGFWRVFERTASQGVIRGNLVSDAHLVALMRQHGVATIWTSDRDFRRFDTISVRDPFA
ncbi:MAG TPA: TA system VapC family ribonuclease toxin [Egibacteraceae bacterium]|nr:PIN domain-containing protein [Actinomycetota bacterium]HWB71031.1 TA system VapC family ribonuclease toxin [Egibacteraceae bacterium]